MFEFVKSNAFFPKWFLFQYPINCTICMRNYFLASVVGHLLDPQMLGWHHVSQNFDRCLHYHRSCSVIFKTISFSDWSNKWNWDQCRDSMVKIDTTSLEKISEISCWVSKVHLKLINEHVSIQKKICAKNCSHILWTGFAKF